MKEEKSKPLKSVTTGIATDDLYYLTPPLIEALLQSTISVNALRLLHALLHLICREIETRKHPGPYVNRPLRIRSALLREKCGWGSSKGNRELSPALDELLETGWFDVLKHLHDGLWVEVCFDQAVIDTNDKSGGYALHDISLLPKLRTVLDIKLAMLVCTHRRKQYPKFSLTVSQLAYLDNSDTDDWSKLRPKVVRGLQCVSEHFNLWTCVYLGEAGMKRGIDTITVFPLMTARDRSMRNLLKVKPDIRRAIIISRDQAVDCRPDSLFHLINSQSPL